ncbi:endonuclease/exonuclease/phosphatase family protein [Shewanella colwelliana]|uniref:Succinyl-CoA synthetase subunit alpha n=1 Tax=Shewanella colwelliana TaxID=23 RepID=A0ABQ4NZ94_SHECO|nr:endonuclease/exonuclease/phosphatase family protein [Shewanella colwelliana]GIU40389.1 succinyl-CoA synthetase subunit alpha [Shewanella colwelliana]
MKLLKTAAAIAVSVALLAGCNSSDDNNTQSETVRFATYNISFDRTEAGKIYEELAAGESQQIKHIAEVLQRTRPDVVFLTEFDHDGVGLNDQGVKDFNSKFLGQSQNGAEPIDYPYYYLAPTNTGLLASKDLDGNGIIALPNDAYGFGFYHGQYAFVVMSKYPLDTDNIRSFQKFLWKDMPNAALPTTESGDSYYSEEALSDFRLSSKNHIDVPVKIGEHTVHLLGMHPTPPVFDGPEDRNGKRNHDEIRLFSDYISDDVTQAYYLIDDKGTKGGLGIDASFIIAGDFNADPVDGDSYQYAIRQLLNHSRVSQEVAVGNYIPQSKGAAEYQTDKPYVGNPGDWTQLYPLRLDYVLPSNNLDVVDSGVYWEEKDSPQRYLFENEAGEQGKSVSSDHRLVWVDIKLD